MSNFATCFPQGRLQCPFFFDVDFMDLGLDHNLELKSCLCTFSPRAKEYIGTGFRDASGGGVKGFILLSRRSLNKLQFSCNQ